MKKQGRALTKYVKVSPRKARLVADLVRGQMVEEAIVRLQYHQAKSAPLVLKTLESAIANAEMNDDARRDLLYVETVFVDEGPTMKRGKARSRGSRSPILKRSSHITVVVAEKEVA